MKVIGINEDYLVVVPTHSFTYFNTYVIYGWSPRQVEEIRILRSYELTMRAVSVLLEQCPNLHILAEMDGWEGISQLELLQLRKKIREENLDLDTFIAWSVTG